MPSLLWALWKFYMEVEASVDEDHRGNVPFSLHRIKGTDYQHDITLTLTLIAWPRKSFIRFLQC